MLKFIFTFLLCVLCFTTSLKAQQWELIDFGQGVTPNDEVIPSGTGVKEFIQGELHSLVYNLTGNTITGRGIAKSTDGGQTWTKTWFPSNLTNVTNFVINPLSSNEWYVTRHHSTNNTSQYIVYKSNDFGQTWTSFGQGLLPPLSNSIITVVELGIDFSNGKLVGMLQEEGSDYVDWYGIERSVSDSTWDWSLFATSSAGIWSSGKLKVDKNPNPNIFWIGGEVKNSNFPSFSRYKIITTTNDSLFVSKISTVKNSDLMFANSGNTIYKNEFGWQGNGNWETVNWSINGITINDYDFIWSDGDEFILLQLEFDSPIVINSEDYYVFYSNDNGNTWQSLPITGINSSTNPLFLMRFVTSFKNIFTYINPIGGTFGDFYKFDLNLLITDLKENRNFAGAFNLSQNYPNPFNPITSISYQYPLNNRGKITIFNTLGQRIKEFKLKESNGSVVWDGTNEMGNSVSSGIYFYQLKSDKFTETKSMAFLK